MSGVEIAGLVLGAFPLLVTAVEHYRDGADAISDYRKFKLAYKKCHRDLTYLHLCFEETLKDCLLPLVVDDDELKRLLADPGGKEWKDQAMDDRLEKRLPQSYVLYKETVEEMNEIMAKLKDDLMVEDTYAGATAASGLPAKAKSASFNQRIKFIWDRRERDVIFNRMEKLMQRLRDLLTMGEKRVTVDLPKSRSRVSKSDAALTEFWRHACKLYALISRSWGCQCGPSHCVNFLLRQRTSTDSDFNIAFLFSRSNGHSSPHWNWQEAHIRVIKKQIKPITATVPTVLSVPTMSASSSTSSLASAPVISRSAPQKRHGVLKNWISDNPLRSRKPKLARPPELLQAPPTPLVTLPQRPKLKVSFTEPVIPSSMQNTTEVTKLCASLKSCDPAPSCMGFLDADQESFCIYPTVNRKDFKMNDTVSLSTLLSRTAGQRLTRAERYSVALILAASHVELQASPWLGKHWTKDDIIFLRDSSNPDVLLVQKPYLLRDVPHDAQSPTLAPDDCSFISLGIALLELCFGTPIEQHPMWQKYYSDGTMKADSFGLLAIALQWRDYIGGEAGGEYAEAVNWCLEYKKNVAGSWRREFDERVVQSLEQCQIQPPTKLQLP
ncbi:hypothetical protein EJ08DRAFT_378173 [Tothia fuscella]|uniref:DUF7580 domain-containing protein n=1 Tax=Tothia fuscella TaxID=1048955 RepID=A0A9P4TWB7_9PEZI|nr:hypothetical protein EJ08DRAFT_378173 [Tothia fuscella]